LKLAKCAIYIDLLEVGLSQSSRILFVLPIRPLENNLSIPDHPLARDEHASLLILIESQLVYPSGFALTVRNGDPNLDIGIPAGSQASDCSHTTAPMRSFLKSSTGLGQVSQEAECVEEVGFSGGVGANQKDTTRKICLAGGEILPVSQSNVGEA